MQGRSHTFSFIGRVLKIIMYPFGVSIKNRKYISCKPLKTRRLNRKCEIIDKTVKIITGLVERNAQKSLLTNNYVVNIM